MKHFATVFLFLFFAFNVRAATDTLTIGEAFDWQVGDTLMYGEYQYVNFPYPPNGPGPVHSHHPTKGFLVVGRNNFSDTIQYFIRWTTGVDDTLVFSSLDTPVTKFSYSVLYSHFGGCEYLQYAPTCDTSWVNCYMNDVPYLQIGALMVNEITHMGFETGFSATFVENIGIENAGYGAQEYWPNWPMGYAGSCGVELVYYKSVSFEWRSQFYTSVSKIKPTSFRLSPNPVTDELTVAFDEGNHTPFDAYIYDVTGNLMCAHKNISPNMNNISVSHLPAGYYVLKLIDAHASASSKGFIIAR